MFRNVGKIYQGSVKTQKTFDTCKFLRLKSWNIIWCFGIVHSFLLFMQWHCQFVELYRVIQDETSIFWKVILSAIARKKSFMFVYLILKFYRGRAVWITRLISSNFLLLAWMKRKLHKIELDTSGEFLACILDTAVRTKKCQYHLRPKVRDLCKQAAEWDFRKLFVRWNKFFIFMSQIYFLNIILKFKK
jgi:hypothetical protein